MSELSLGTPEFNPKVEEKPNLYIKDLINRQLGKLVDRGSAYSSRCDEVVEQKTGITYKSAAEFQLKHMPDAIALVKEFPGIYTDDNVQELVAKMESGKASFGAIVRWARLGVLPDGGIPLVNNVAKGLTIVRDEDFQEILKIADHYKEKVREEIQKYIDEFRKQSKHISKIVENYRGGKKPEPNDILHSRDLEGGSITEPILQGGTPEEGLTHEVNCLLNPLRIYLKDPELSPFIVTEDESEEKVRGSDGFAIKLGYYPLLFQGREVARKYYGFISDILLQDPSIRARTQERKEMSRKSALSDYAELEWQRRGDAIALAEEIKQMTDELIIQLEGMLNN